MIILCFNNFYYSIAKGRREQVEENISNNSENQTTVRFTSARPASARPAPPKIVVKRDIDEELAAAAAEEKERLQNAKPVKNLIVDANEDEKAGGEEFIVEEPDKNEEETLALKSHNSGENEKGSLVKQLVETRKELEGKGQESEKSTIRLGTRDIETLRQSIQTLSQNANPLGRILDYLQEDIDGMINELKTWQEEYQKNTRQLEIERGVTDNDVENLREQLNTLDKEIEDQLEKTSVAKAGLLRNEDKLKQMTSSWKKI